MNPDIKKLTTYPEFYTLKKELLAYLEKNDDILKNLDRKSQTFGFQAAVALETNEKIEDLLQTLGLLSRAEVAKKKQTYE